MLERGRGFLVRSRGCIFAGVFEDDDYYAEAADGNCGGASTFPDLNNVGFGGGFITLSIYCGLLFQHI